jgi:arabinose-5-phosphate isomerase
MADALAVCLLEIKNFKEKDFALFHPGGALGRRLLLTVEDIMRTSKNNPIVAADIRVSEVLVKITQARAGAATIVDKKGKLSGIFTDGDLRRHLEADPDLPRKLIGDVMTKNPLVVRKETLAAEALHLMEQKKVGRGPGSGDKGRPIGLLDVQDVLRARVV